MSTSHDSLFYGGGWHQPSAGAGVIDVVSPTTEEVIGSVPHPTEQDVDAAVAAARQAFDDPEGWAQWSVERRAEVMEQLADILQSRIEDFAQLVSAQNGMPITLSRLAEGWTGPVLLRYYASMIRERGIEHVRTTDSGASLVRAEPLGVVAAIVPWNFPMGTAFMKLAPALAAGCSVVLKPATETVLDAYLLAQCILESDLPAGVVNILPAGREIGAYLVGHLGIDKVAFTGSTRGGREIAKRCGELLRPVSLELGGKSAAVVLDDADLVSLKDEFLYATMANNGQTCWLNTRILLPRQRFAELTDTITDIVAAQTVGDPLDDSTEIGPMTSSTHRDRVEGYIKAGLEAGGRVTTGGGRPKDHASGWFVEPTIFVDVDNSSIVAQEEIFGPVLCLIPYDGVDDAVGIANDSKYGLGGTVWTADEEHGVDVARRIRTGIVGINSFRGTVAAPFGGVKESGIGREMGPEGLANYQSLKSVHPNPNGTWQPS